MLNKKAIHEKEASAKKLHSLLSLLPIFSLSTVPLEKEQFVLFLVFSI